MVVKDILLVILTYYKKENQNKKVLRDFITKGVHSHGKIASQQTKKPAWKARVKIQIKKFPSLL